MSLTINKHCILDVVEKEPEFYLKDWLPIPQGTITIISSLGGVGKTWLVIQMALRFILENQDKKVFLWLSEDLESIIKNRMKSICGDILSTSLDTRFKNITTTDTAPLSFLQRENGVYKISEKFEQLKTELKDFDLVVFDPLLAFYGADENDNSQARVFMQSFMNWARETNKSIIFLHHSNKSDGNTRGASAFVDAVRVCYELTNITSNNSKNPDLTSSHLSNIKLSKDNYGALKYLLETNVKRWIIPNPREHKKGYDVL